jgi:hypothetical protein
VPIQIRIAVRADTEAWLRMRHTLWPDASLDEHRENIARYFMASAGL